MSYEQQIMEIYSTPANFPFFPDATHQKSKANILGNVMSDAQIDRLAAKVIANSGKMYTSELLEREREYARQITKSYDDAIAEIYRKNLTTLAGFKIEEEQKSEDEIEREIVSRVISRMMQAGKK